MTRQIKFRAWFKEEKEMRDVAMLRWENDRMVRIAGYWNGTKNNGWTDYDPQDNKIVLMQFTELLDKDGKEIYEGDIIDGNWENEFGSFTSDKRQVSYCVHKAGFEAMMIPDDGRHCSIGSNVIVVGNIYESNNPK